jgi:hypothetical protein
MESRPTLTLPDRAAAELEVALERAHRETRVLDRLHALWALLLAKCCLLQAAIERWRIPVDGWLVVWASSLSLAALATVLHLRAHRLELARVPANTRVSGALLAGLAILALGAAHAGVGLGLFGAPALGAALLSLAGLHGLVQAALRRRPEPLVGALLAWGAAWSCLHAGGPDIVLAWCGAGLLAGAALPSFALVRAADRRS